MQVYKSFLRIARAKLSSTIIYFIVFLALTVLMSTTAASDYSSKFEISSVNICIIDEDHSTASRALYDYLGSMHTLVTFDSYDRETLQDHLYYQSIDYILTIPEGFEEGLISGKKDILLKTTKRQDSVNGYFLDQQVDSYIQDLSLYVTGGSAIEEAVTAVNTALAGSPEVTSVRFEKKSSGENSAMYYFFQYLPYVILMMLLEGLTPVLLAFNRKDLGARINCSSLDVHAKNAQIGLGCISYSLIIWTVFVILGILMYHPSRIFSKNGLLCLLNSFVFMLIATSITLIVSALSIKGQTSLSMISNTLGLGMSFLCGVFVPQMFLGDKVLSFARFLPVYWYVRITDMFAGFSNEPLSMNTYWMCIGIQLLFFAAIFCVYLAVSRQKKRTSLA